MKFTSLLHLCIALLLSLPVTAQTVQPASPTGMLGKEALETRIIERTMESFKEFSLHENVEEEMNDGKIGAADPIGEIESDELFIDAPGRLQQLNLDSLRAALKVRVRRNAQEGTELNLRIERLSKDIETRSEQLRKLRELGIDTAEFEEALVQARQELDSARVSVRTLMAKKNGRGKDGFTMTVINDSAQGVQARNFMMVLDESPSGGTHKAPSSAITSLDAITRCGKQTDSRSFSDSLYNDLPTEAMLDRADQEDSVAGMPIASMKLKKSAGTLSGNTVADHNRSASTIAFTLPKPAHATLTIFDADGNTVKVLADESLPAGRHSRTLDARDVPNGTYLYKLVAGDFSEMQMVTVEW